MDDKSAPYLCGGTLFFLLLQIRLNKIPAQERAAGNSDKMADRHVMNGLVYAVTDYFDEALSETLRKDTSNYRECKIPGSSAIPFHTVTTFNAYEEALEHDYHAALSRMTEFVTEYLNQSKYITFVKYILEVVEQDEIADDEPLYFLFDTRKTKADLRKMTAFEIQPLLMGLMYFILKERRDNAGTDTLEMWGNKEPRRERVFTKTNLGSTITKKISVKLSQLPEPMPAEEPAKSSTINKTSPDTEKSSQDLLREKILASGKALASGWQIAMDGLAADMAKGSEQKKIEAEVVDDEEPSGAAGDEFNCDDKSEKESPRIQIVQNPTIYNQHAEKIYNIEHVDHLD